VQQIAAAGGAAIAVAVDVADPDSVQRLVGETVRAFGDVHILFSNAAVQVSKTWKIPHGKSGTASWR